jgi:hypothetical protein
MLKDQFLLKLDGELIKTMKIPALESDRNVNDITEELWRGYLAAPIDRTRSSGTAPRLPKNRRANATEGNRAKVGEGRRPGAVPRGLTRRVDQGRRERR